MHSQQPSVTNLLSNIPQAIQEELVQTLIDVKGIRIERILSHGHASPEGFWYDQHQHEWITLLQGAATLQFENQTKPLELKPGDCINIPAHQRHRLQWTTSEEPTLWLAIHYD